MGRPGAARAHDARPRAAPGLPMDAVQLARGPLRRQGPRVSLADVARGRTVREHSVTHHGYRLRWPPVVHLLRDLEKGTNGPGRAVEPARPRCVGGIRDAVRDGPPAPA